MCVRVCCQGDVWSVTHLEHGGVDFLEVGGREGALGCEKGGDGDGGRDGCPVACTLFNAWSRTGRARPNQIVGCSA